MQRHVHMYMRLVCVQIGHKDSDHDASALHQDEDLDEMDLSRLEEWVTHDLKGNGK